MSRHKVTHDLGDRVLVVGWDNPARSFFYQLFENQSDFDAGEPCDWQGYMYDEIPEIDDLLRSLKEKHNIALHEVAIRTLIIDKEGMVEPTSLQKRITELFGKVRNITEGE